MAEQFKKLINACDKGASDVMFHQRKLFLQILKERKNDPVPQNPNQSWKKLIGPGGPPVDYQQHSAPVGSVEQKENEKNRCKK